MAAECFRLFPPTSFKYAYIVSTEAEGSKCYSHPFASKLQIKKKSGVSRRLQAAMPSCKWKNLSLRFFGCQWNHPNPWWDIEKPDRRTWQIINLRTNANSPSPHELWSLGMWFCFFFDIVTVYNMFLVLDCFFGNNISFLLPCTNNKMILEKYLLMNLM